MISEKYFKELKNFDFVQVNVNNEWVNGVVIGDRFNGREGEKIYIQYKDERWFHGNEAFFYKEQIRLPNFNIENYEVISEIKKLVYKLKI